MYGEFLGGLVVEVSLASWMQVLGLVLLLSLVPSAGGASTEDRSDCPCDRFGTLVAAYDDDFGFPLFWVNHAFVYVDANGDSTWSVDEAVYLKRWNWGDTPLPAVQPGDLRVTIDAGTIVRTDDPDEGMPLVDGQGSLLSAASGGLRRVYLHLGPATGAVVQGDIRLMDGPGGVAGSIVGAADVDAGWPGFPSGGIATADLDGDGRHGSGEPVYVTPFAQGVVTVGTGRLAGVPTSLETWPVAGAADGFPLALQARLSDAAGRPLRGQTVDFLAAGQRVCTAVTAADGVASCGSAIAVARALAAGGHEALFNGAGFLCGSKDAAPILQL